MQYFLILHRNLQGEIKTLVLIECTTTALLSYIYIYIVYLFTYKHFCVCTGACPKIYDNWERNSIISGGNLPHKITSWNEKSVDS